MKIIRYSLNPLTPATAADSDPDVRHGDLSELPAEARLLPPCSPSKIVCVGRNYAEHAKELGNEVPASPLIFLKPAGALLKNGGTLILPPQSSRVDHEVEVVVGIHADGRPRYAIGIDVTARDLQAEAKKKGEPWTLSKGFK